MGFWSFLKKKSEPAARVAGPVAVTSPPPLAVHALDRLGRTGDAGGPSTDEALAIFAGLRGTPDEARATDELARIALARSLPDDLVLALGLTLVDRGEHEVAERVLASTTSSPALVLLADLAERHGDLSVAIARIERVLLRDLDYPGARERHRRWRESLGLDIVRKPAAAGVTVVAREPDAPFDLLREIGRGGAAAVYEALDRELKRPVALKVYHQPERDRAQLAHEAKVAVALEGAGIVRVFDLDPDHGWIALEWAEGKTIRERIRSTELRTLLAFERWTVDLAAALARVHAAGWVHHDVKPANVLLDRAGSPVLTDFGTARRANEPSPPGSLGYISPERMKGRASDPRDDVYGFGRVLEDVLAAAKDVRVHPRFRSLAADCTGPDDARPHDGRALLTRLRVEI